MNRKMLAVSFLSLIVLLFVNACGPTAPPETATPVPPTATAELPTATAEPPQDPEILFIGDSFTSDFRGLDNHIEGLAASNDPTLSVEADKVTFGNTSLWGHWLGNRAVPTIQKGNWTVVVLQDDLGYYDDDEQEFKEYAHKFDEEIKNIGAETVLYMSWYAEDDDTAQYFNIYPTLSEELGAKVAPVGLAWSRSIAERPDLDLYDDDRLHANVSGTYLALAVLYATIFDESPEGLPYLPSDLIGGEESALYEEWKISEEDIAFLQRIAWETVVEYQEENN